MKNDLKSLIIGILGTAVVFLTVGQTKKSEPTIKDTFYEYCTLWSNHDHLNARSKEEYLEQNFWRNGSIKLYECVSNWKAGKEAAFTLVDLEQGGWRVVDIEKTNFGKGIGSDLQIMWVFERVSTPELAKKRRDAMSI